MTKRRFATAAVILLVSLSVVAAEEAREPAPQKRTVVVAQCQDLYDGQSKVGYQYSSLARIDEGNSHVWQIETSEFLIDRRGVGVEVGVANIRYLRKIQAKVDSNFVPLEVEATVTEPELNISVTGKRQGKEFLMTKTVNGKATEGRIALEPDLTLHSAVRYRAFLEGLKVGQSWRWPVIDEILAAKMPEDVVCQVVGEGTENKGKARKTIYVVVIAQDRQVMACFMDENGYWRRVDHQGRNWTELLASFESVRQFGPPRPDLEDNRVPGLGATVYANEEFGFRFTNPGYPWSITQVGNLRLLHVTGNDWVDFEVVGSLSPEATAESLEAFNLSRWAARYHDVKVTYRGKTTVASAAARKVKGTARLGCSHLAFEHIYIMEQGFGYMIEAAAVDKEFGEIRTVMDSLVDSFRLMPPRGRIPGRFIGQRFESPYYLFSVSRPDKAWVVPTARQGLRTAIEFVKNDRTALALVRIEPTDKDFPGLNAYAKDYVAQVRQKLPDAKDITCAEGRLSSAPAACVRYTSAAMDDALCRTTQWISLYEGRVYHLILITLAEKAEANEADLEAIYKGFEFLPLPEGAKEEDKN